jgi:hypothetical protein
MEVCASRALRLLQRERHRDPQEFLLGVLHPVELDDDLRSGRIARVQWSVMFAPRNAPPASDSCLKALSSSQRFATPTLALVAW